MPDQNVINIIVGTLGTLGGFILKAVWDSVKDLQKSDKEISEKVGKIEVLVAGNYVNKEEFNRTLSALFVKLDKIAEKLDGKADRSERA